MMARRAGRRGIALLIALLTVALSGAVLAAVFAWTAVALRTGRAAADRSRALADAESAVGEGMRGLAALPEPGVQISDSVWVYPVEGRGSLAVAPVEVLVRWQAAADSGGASARPAGARWRLVPIY
jgi:Tfp pilus assembly protein PilX